MDIVSVLGHISFIIIALSFVMKDIVWLRIVSILGSVFSIFFNYFIPGGPIWIVIGWSFVFITIHSIRLVSLLLERQAVVFTPEEQEIYDTVFQAFSPVEFMKLLRIGSWRNITESETLIQAGDKVDEITFIYNGRADIWSDGKLVNSVRDGAFVGEMEFLSNSEASATVQATSQLRCLVWSVIELHQLLVRNPTMYLTMQSLFSTDLVKKLRAMA